MRCEVAGPTCSFECWRPAVQASLVGTTFPPQNYLNALVKSQLTIKVRVCANKNSPHYFRLVGNLKISQREPSLSFKIVLAIPSLSNFYVNLRISVSVPSQSQPGFREGSHRIGSSTLAICRVSRSSEHLIPASGDHASKVVATRDRERGGGSRRDTVRLCLGERFGSFMKRRRTWRRPWERVDCGMTPLGDPAEITRREVS